MGKVIALVILVAVVGYFALFSGSKQEIDPARVVAYQNAIEKYLAEKSMGMKIKEFVSIEEQGDKATAKVKMQLADGGVAMAVMWTFVFVKENDSWKVSELIKK